MWQASSLCVALFWLFSTTPIIITAQSYLTDGLVAYFPFEAGSPIDKSGNGNHLAVIGGPNPTTDKHGVPNSALSFSSSGQYLIREGFRNLATGNLPRSIAALAYVSQLSSGNTSTIASYGSMTSHGCFGLAIDSSKWKAETWQIDLVSVVTIQLDTWVHVVATHDGDVTRLYLNGAPIAQASFSLATGSNTLIIGQKLDLMAGFTGTIDEVRIFNRSLSEDEVFALYGYEFSPSPSISTSPSASVSASASMSSSVTASATPSKTTTHSETSSGSASPTPSTTSAPSSSPSATPSPSIPASISYSSSDTTSPTMTPSASLSITPSPSPGLVAYFPFNNGSPNDESGNGNNMFAVGNPTATADRFGNPNSALELNGNEQYLMRIGFHNLPTGNRSRTVSALTYITQLPTAWGGIVNYGSVATHGSFGLSINNKVWMAQSLGDDLASTVTPQLNTWAHVTATYDGTTVSLFLNGVPIAQGPYALSTGTAQLMIGLMLLNTTDAFYFTGKIDEVRVYNQALLEQEVFALFRSEFTPSTISSTISPSASTTPSTTGSQSTTQTKSVTPSMTPSVSVSPTPTTTATPSSTQSTSFSSTATLSTSPSTSISPNATISMTSGAKDSSPSFPQLLTALIITMFVIVFCGCMMFSAFLCLKAFRNH